MWFFNNPVTKMVFSNMVPLGSRPTLLPDFKKQRNIAVTTGDAHGNFLLELRRLINIGVVKEISKEVWEEFYRAETEIKKPSFNVNVYLGLIEKHIVPTNSPIFRRCLGDDLADRWDGPDILMLALYSKIPSACQEIIYSNHAAFFMRWYEKFFKDEVSLQQLIAIFDSVSEALSKYKERHTQLQGKALSAQLNDSDPLTDEEQLFENNYRDLKLSSNRDAWVAEFLNKNRGLFANCTDIEAKNLLSHYCEFKVTGENQHRSFFRTVESLQSKQVSLVQARELVEEYKKALKLFSYDKTDKGIILYAHSAVDFHIIESVAQFYQVAYDDSTVEKLAETIDAINAAFQETVQKGELALLEPLDIEVGPIYKNHPILSVIWGRPDACVTALSAGGDEQELQECHSNEVRSTLHHPKKSYPYTFVHGHMGKEADLGKTCLNLDTDAGKGGSESVATKLLYYKAPHSVMLHQKSVMSNPSSHTASPKPQDFNESDTESSNNGVSPATSATLHDLVEPMSPIPQSQPPKQGSEWSSLMHSSLTDPYPVGTPVNSQYSIFYRHPQKELVRKQLSRSPKPPATPLTRFPFDPVEDPKPR